MPAGNGLARQMILPLQIVLGDGDVHHSHANIAVSE